MNPSERLKMRDAVELMEQSIAEAKRRNIVGLMKFVFRHARVTAYYDEERGPDGPVVVIRRTLALHGGGLLFQRTRCKAGAAVPTAAVPTAAVPTAAVLLQVQSVRNTTDLFFDYEMDDKGREVYRTVRPGNWMPLLERYALEVKWWIDNRHVMKVVNRFAPLEEEVA